MFSEYFQLENFELPSVDFYQDRAYLQRNNGQSELIFITQPGTKVIDSFKNNTINRWRKGQLIKHSNQNNIRKVRFENKLS